MRIELSKDITVKKLEFVGEVDFFEESPYIGLLQNILTEEELRTLLNEKDLGQSAINNVIEKLKTLGVLEDGDIVKLENGFPEREYGKYSLEFFENDTQLPFRYKNKEIKREWVVSKNRADGIKKDEYLMDKVYQKSNNFSDDKIFQILKLEKDNYIEESQKKSQLKLKFNKNKWFYNIEEKPFEMKEIDFDNLFEGNWDFEQNALKVDFKTMEEKEECLVNFEDSYFKDITLAEYGKLKGNFQNIPIMPKTKNDALQWLLYLLKVDIEKKNRYISKDELRSLWSNILDTKPLLELFDLEFDFEKVLEKFGRDSKYYWLLQSGIDLFPFETGLTSKARVIIKAIENIDLENDFVSKFNMHNPKDFIIVDRWINRLAHFKALEQILKAVGNPKITLVTQALDKNISDEDKKEIQDIIGTNNITKIEKQKKEIVHSRYWIFDNKKFYKTNNSLDVMKVEDESVTLKEQTTFDLYDKKDLEPELMIMLGEINNG